MINPVAAALASEETLKYMVEHAAKKVETFKELSFIEAKKDGLIYQLTDGYWCYDNTRYDTATDALKACNDHLRKTSI